MSIQTITRLFPLWAVLFSLLAFYAPSLFTGWKPAIVPLLIIIMFCMGMTLTLDNFRDVLKQPRVLAIGIILQYTVMPLAAFVIAWMLGLSLPLMIGMLLVGSAPGGTASNVVCYLARGNVALSVTLTMLSTLLAFIMTPAMVWLYIGEKVPVPVLDMLLSVMKIVLAPVLLGTLVNTMIGKKTAGLRHVFPLLSMLAIIAVIAIIVALNKQNISTVGALVIIAVVLHNTTGLVIGYWIAKMLGYDNVTARTIAIETGMQNSGLSVALAIKYFSPSAALPGAVFSIWHNISGSLLAGFWSGRSRKND
jgi:BASS family bile acid:Na+ symporter